MGDMKKLHEEMRDIHATVQKLEDLPASFHTLSDTIAQLTAAVNALVANTPSAPTSTAVTHSDANQATPETVVLSPPDPTPSTRVTRLEFPTFSGKEDPLVWLHRCELFFDKSPVSDHEKVSTAAYYMFDVAQLWFSKRIQDNQQFSWAQFKAACTLRFGPPRSINPLGELANLKQNSRNLEEGTAGGTLRNLGCLLASTPPPSPPRDGGLCFGRLTCRIRHHFRLTRKPSPISRL
nr:putative mitochondrial protein [Ipomoea batatas]